MALSQTEILSELQELSADAFEAFCGDISGMFGVEMESELAADSKETARTLKKIFKRFSAVITIKATGILEGDFHIVFDKEALFTLSGTIIMLPEKGILENCKKGSEKDAQEQQDAVGETGNLLVGSWDRIFRENLEGHTHFLQTGTFIGNPWGDCEKILGVSKEEEFLYFGCEMSVGEFPPFQCGVIFPDAIFQKTSQEASEEVSQEEKKVPESAEEPEGIRPEAQEAEIPPDANEQIEPQAQAVAENSEEIEAEPEEDQSLAENQVETESEEAPERSEEKESEENEVKAETPEDISTESKPQETQNIDQVDQGDEQESHTTMGAALTDSPAEAEHRETAKGAVSETIQKMVESMPIISSDKISEILNISAKDIMTKQVLWGKPDDSVQYAIEKIQQADAACMLVGNSDALEGIVTWINIAETVSVYLRPVFSKWRTPMDDATLQIKLKVIMTRPVRTINPQTTLANIMEDMCQHRLRCLPVLGGDGKVAGVVTASDIFRFMLKMSPDFSVTDPIVRSV